MSIRGWGLVRGSCRRLALIASKSSVIISRTGIHAGPRQDAAMPGLLKQWLIVVSSKIPDNCMKFGEQVSETSPDSIPVSDRQTYPMHDDRYNSLRIAYIDLSQIARHYLKCFLVC